MPEPAVEEYQAFARPKIEAGGYNWETFRKQIQQESGWRHLDANGNVKTSYTGSSKGISQLNQRFYGPEIWTDPWTNLSKGIELAVGYLARFGSHRRALAAFNYGPGHVGGGRFDDGRGFGVQDHSPWDGAPDWRCSAGHGLSNQVKHYLDTILGPGWPEPSEGPMQPSQVTYEDYRDPGHALFTRTPKGVVLHGSRSGSTTNTLDQEYRGTANWELNNPNGYAWHATIGPGKVALHLTPQEWGQHDPWASQEYLGVEFAQPRVSDSITDEQVAAFVDWFKTRVQPAWPSIPLHFPSHAEVDREYGQNQGKSDVFPLGDSRMDDLRGRIMARLQGDKPIVETYSVGEGILTAMTARGEVPATDEMFTKRGEYDEWSEAYSNTGRRYMWLPSVGRIFVYDPAA